MKYHATITLLITLLFSSTQVSSQNTEEATQYMYEVTKKAFELDDETWNYLKAVTKGKKASKVEDRRKALTSAIKTAKLSIARKGDFQGSFTLRDAIVNYLDLRYTVLKEDYDKILDMEAIAEQSYDGMEAYLLAQEKASEKLDSAFKIMSGAQRAFADKYKITLTDSRDKMGEQIRKASETLSYYNDVYLIFFKVYKQEAYVLDAISRADVSSIEQNNSTLQEFSKLSLAEIKTFKSYKGDASLKAACQKAITFYKGESENEFASLSDYFLKKDEFEKIQKRLESLSKKERTQKDIDKYNNALNAFNGVNNNFNKAMKSSYDNRVKMLNEWNRKVEFFINNHSK